MKQLLTTLSLLCLLFSCGDKKRLTTEIDNIISSKQLLLGVAIYDSEDDTIISVNPNIHFPMQSVYKFHIALAMLNQIDQGLFALSDSITVTQSQLLPETWSPFRDQYPDGATVTLAELIESTLINSDNNISDIIMEMVGGTASVQKYSESIGLTNTNICSYERELQTDWEQQFFNYTTPLSAVELLHKFENHKLLENTTHNFLWNAMSRTYTSSIRDSLPVGTTVAHKSGFSGVGADGVVAANNDIGIMVLPNGRKIIFSIFISQSKESPEECYKIISQIGSTIYNYYN